MAFQKQKFIIILFMFILAFFSQFVSYAQTVEVSGNVKDTNGGVLPDITVTEQGSTKATVTDQQGQFSLKVSSLQGTLVFTSVGYQKKSIKLVGRNQVSVILNSVVKDLTDVVVVGYSTTKKANLTGAVSSIKLSDIDGLPISNAASALQGRMAGVTVSAFTGQPGKNDPQIRIRGIGTFGNNNPLVVIDGVPNEVSDLSEISIDDIESVSVLKDAASASIYGVRAANGVILVTTKRGKVGKPKIQYRATRSWQKPLLKPRYMDGLQWATAYNEFLIETGAAPVYDSIMLQKIKDQSDPDNFANTDWFSEVYKTAPLNMQYLSVSGGTDVTKYLFSMEYSDQKGIMVNTKANRIQFRGNLDSKISDHLNFGVNLRGYKQNIEEPIASATQNDAGDNGINRVISGFTRPTAAARYSFGEFGLFDGTSLAQIKNPLKSLFEQKNSTDVYRFEGKVFGQLKFLKDFSFTSSLGVVYASTLNYTFSPSTFNYRPDGTTTATAPSASSASNASSSFTKYIIENLLRYERKFSGKHDLKVMIGQTAQHDELKGFNASVRNLPSNQVVVLGASAELPSNGGSASAFSLQSFLGRINYLFNDKYIFEVNARMDGSSKLPPSQQYPIFPSASAGWIISKEGFYGNVSNTINFLKLRASWGQLGNQDIGNYAFTQNYTLGQNYLFNNVLTQGAAINNYSNSNIRWETTTQTDIGLEMEVLNRKLKIEAGVFDKNTSNILVQLPIPNTLGGLGAPNQNAGKVNNRGIELLLNYADKIGKLEYNIALNGTSIKNKITSTAGRENWINGNTINQVGNPINAYFGYMADGLYKSQDEVNKGPKQFGSIPRVGDIKYIDVSGNGDVTTDDRVILGNPFPKLTYGFNLGLKYASFDFTAFFQGIYGINRYYDDPAAMGVRSQKLLVWNNRWTVNNPEGNLPRWGNTTNNNSFSSFRLEDASYVRLKNIELGYSLSQEMIAPIGLSNLRIYFNGINLLTIANQKDYDVEKSENDIRSLDYMNTKQVSFGLSATFK
jgi:TonB-dependent starch-binding outer membrane protein SusC